MMEEGPRYPAWRRGTAAALAGAMLLCRPAAAQPTAACPSEPALERAIGALASASGEGPDRFTLDKALTELRVEDLGARFRVTLRGQTRVYEDAERDCERRARVVAVFVALVLSPGYEPEPQQSDRPSPPVTKTTSTPPTEPARPAEPGEREASTHRWAIELGAGLALAPLPEQRIVLPGVGLAGVWMWGDWGAALGGEVPFIAAQLLVGPTTAELSRTPAHLGVRAQWQLGALEAGLEASVVGALVRVSRDQVSSVWVEPGLRLSAFVRLAERTFTPFLGASCEWVPTTHSLALEPDGPLTHTPALWIGATAGISFGTSGQRAGAGRSKIESSPEQVQTGFLADAGPGGL